MEKEIYHTKITIKRIKTVTVCKRIHDKTIILNAYMPNLKIQNMKNKN
jgi:hypothetical protein